jgi:hypothetical protein
LKNTLPLHWTLSIWCSCLFPSPPLLWTQKMLKHFTFVFHEVSPHLPCVVINEIHIIPTFYNGFCLYDLHIWVDLSHPSLGFMIKARGCKVVGPRRKPGSARECEGIDPHTPKGTPSLGVGVPVDSWMFKERFQRSKPNGLMSSLYHWKCIET